jgi:hypothetical protein
MIASEYKNCFWNASGDLSCPGPGYSGPNVSDYPNWKLFNNVNTVAPYNNKGYFYDYEPIPQQRQRGGGNRYTQYKYQQPQVVSQNRPRGHYVAQGRENGVHCQQQFGGHNDIAYEYYDKIFARPNTHGLGGNGWGDAQIMGESEQYNSGHNEQNYDMRPQPVIQEPRDICSGHIPLVQEPLARGSRPVPHSESQGFSQMTVERSDEAEYNLQAESEAPNWSHVGQGKDSPVSHLASYSNHGYTKPVWRQKKLTSMYGNQDFVPPIITQRAKGSYLDNRAYAYSAYNPESNYDTPNYLAKRYEQCGEPDPANLNAQQQYANILMRYDDPGHSQFGQNIAGKTNFADNWQNQFEVTNSPTVCYDVYNKKGDLQIQAPSYATILMNERPFLNPNPYALEVPNNSNAGAMVPYGTMGQQGGYYQQQYLQPHPQQQQQHQQRLKFPGQDLLPLTDSSFKERFWKMVGEIGVPANINKGKNGIRAIWQGDRLKEPYKNTFHRVYLNNNDPYPVMTVVRVNPCPDEDLVSKLSFVCDRFKVVPLNVDKSYRLGKGQKGCLLILRGPSFKSNLAKTALALSALRGQVTFCDICDNDLSRKWVWALNPASHKYYDGKAKNKYSGICRSVVNSRKQ